MSNLLKKAQKEQNKHRREELKKDMLLWLSSLPEQRARREEFFHQIDNLSDAQSLLDGNDFVISDLQGEKWVHSRAFHEKPAVEQNAEALRDSLEAEWKDCQRLCGNFVRDRSGRAKTSKLYVLARTYTEEAAAKRLSVAGSVFKEAVKNKDITSFIDPEGRTRIPAEVVEAALHDHEQMEMITQHTPVKLRHISLVAGISYTTAKNKLIRTGINTTRPKWGEVKGLWGLPDTLKEYQSILAERLPEWIKSAATENNRELVVREERYSRKTEKKKVQSRILKQQLLEVFPTWETTNRDEQHITLHLGPTNSGKTFQGLSSLISAGSGWYLSPLRLLAHEVFDTLNKNGVACNLLTGEESIEVEGAAITASTIEMFSPRRSGSCVIIDEAQMLSDSQRGWAWTRAIMETNAPNLHIIGSPIAESLVKRLAGELGFSIDTESYQRLTPLEVTAQPWSLMNLPPKTILVAFSRKIVLGLKSELEKKYHRSVSVVYGNLPPEVRLMQAERFANGETEICIATDAIGMGLNLPADNVCFYETSKYDGNSVRTLSANEIKQIGGRAGRYGLSDHGAVGALNKADLTIIRTAINSSIEDIGFAYVSPTPESIALLPGNLAEKLSRWMELNGIPDKWKQMLKPVDLSEQIALARMLSPADVRRLGEELTLQLINAPCAKNTEPYWQKCAEAILDQVSMPPIATTPPPRIHDSLDLETYELAIRCADIYLWLSQRREFSEFGPQEAMVRANRYKWSMEVDAAFMRQIDTTRRCASCGKILPLDFRYNVCKNCHNNARYDLSYY